MKQRANIAAAKAPATRPAPMFLRAVSRSTGDFYQAGGRHKLASPGSLRSTELLLEVDSGFVRRGWVSLERAAS